MYTGLRAEEQCGWWCRNKRKIMRVVQGVATLTGNIAVAALIEAGIQAGVFRTFPLTLPKEDITKLDNFLIELESWVEIIKAEIKDAISSQNVSLANELLLDIAIVEEYFGSIKKNPLALISENSKLECFEMVKETCGYLSEIIIAGFTDYSIGLKVGNSRNVEPLYKDTTVFKFTHEFVFKKGYNPPKDEIPVDVIIPVDISNPVATITETKKSGFNWWWVVAGFIGYKILK